MIACIPSWVGPPCRRLPPGLRARLWLWGDWLGQHGGQLILWLHLDEGPVLALRLPEAAGEADDAIGGLIAQFADDARGTLLEARLGDDLAIPLYAASAAPLPALPFGNPRHRAAWDIATGLDQVALVLLASLNRHRTWDSLRNYSRLAALDPRLRERRLQALVRFPMLTATVLLSAHEPKKSITSPSRAVFSPRSGTRGEEIAAMPGPLNSGAGAIRGR